MASPGTGNTLETTNVSGNPGSNPMKMKAQDVQPPKSDWELALEEKELSSAKHYSMYDVFSSDDLISHEAFGYGVVVGVHPDNKIEVLFKSGYKMLVHDQII